MKLRKEIQVGITPNRQELLRSIYYGADDTYMLVEEVGMSESSTRMNLRWLLSHEYIVREEIREQGLRVYVYDLTEKGIEALDEIIG